MRAARLAVGDIQVVALPDGAADLPAWPMSPELDGGDPVEWSAYAALAPGGFHGPEHRWRIHNTCYLVLAGGQRILVDCGVGVGPYPWYAGLRGSLPGVMAGAGYDPSDVTRVFLTHAHPDHVGWAFDEEASRPRFEHARYHLHERDWQAFRSREPVPKHFQRFVEPLRSAGVLDLLGGETEIAPGVTAIETPGHTPGHMSLLIRSGAEGLVISGDVLNSPMYVTEPERPFGSDGDPRLGIETRAALVDRIEAEGWRVASAHFPAPGWGDVIRLRGRRWWRGV